jgi:hypothetical protein
MKFATALSTSLAVTLVSGAAVEKRIDNPTSLDCEELGKYPAWYHGQTSAACIALVSILFYHSPYMYHDHVVLLLRRRDASKTSLTASSFGTSLLASLLPLALVYVPHYARLLFCLGLTIVLRPIPFIPIRNARTMSLSIKARLPTSAPMFASLSVVYSSI